MGKENHNLYLRQLLQLLRVSLKTVTIKGFLLLLLIIFISIESADCAARTFYSIQIAALTNLQQTKIQVNSLKKKGEIVFWKKTYIPGKGKFYRVYLGKFTNRADALKIWKNPFQNKSFSQLKNLALCFQNQISPCFSIAFEIKGLVARLCFMR